MSFVAENIRQNRPPYSRRENYYERFPLEAKANVTSGGGGKGIRGLSKCSAGEYVGFALSGAADIIDAVFSVWCVGALSDGA